MSLTVNLRIYIINYFTLEKLRHLIPNKYLILTAYFPAFVIQISTGMLIPVLPLYIQEIGGGLELIGLGVAAVLIGNTIFDIPAGFLSQKYGYKRVITISILIQIILSVSIPFVSNFPLFFLLRFVIGCGMAMWSISLLTNISNTVPQNKRGRYLASLGGINRSGWFIGPLIGGLIGAHISLQAVFIAQAAILLPLFLFITVYFVKSKQENPTLHKTIENDRILNTIQTNFPKLLRGGTAIIPLQIVRSSREILIPLWGATVLGLSVDQIGFVIAGAALIDMAMFLPTGYIMDIKGRKWASIPSCIILAIGISLLPFSNNLLSFTIISILIGFGNGFGNGAMITLGSDLAPPNQRSSFFGAWIFLGGIGGLSGPIVVGQIANAFTLGIASSSIGIIGLIAAAGLHFVVPETLRTKSTNNETHSTLT